MNLTKRLRLAYVAPFDYASLNDAETAERVRASTVKIRDMQRAAVVDIGRELIAVKERLPDGKFLEWIEAEFGWGRRTAVNMMHVAAVFGETWASVSHLPTTVLYKLAAPSTPAAVRDVVLQKIGPTDTIGVSDVRELIDAARASELRKARRDRQEEIRQEQEAHRARWEKQDAKDRREREAKREAAMQAVEGVRQALGPRFADLCEILANVETHLLAAELVRVAQEVRARQVASDSDAVNP